MPEEAGEIPKVLDANIPDAGVRLIRVIDRVSHQWGTHRLNDISLSKYLTETQDCIDHLVSDEGNPDGVEATLRSFLSPDNQETYAPQFIQDVVTQAFSDIRLWKGHEFVVDASGQFDFYGVPHQLIHGPLAKGERLVGFDATLCAVENEDGQLTRFVGVHPFTNREWTTEAKNGPRLSDSYAPEAIASSTREGMAVISPDEIADWYKTYEETQMRLLHIGRFTRGSINIIPAINFQYHMLTYRYPQGKYQERFDELFNTFHWYDEDFSELITPEKLLFGVRHIERGEEAIQTFLGFAENISTSEAPHAQEYFFSLLAQDLVLSNYADTLALKIGEPWSMQVYDEVFRLSQDMVLQSAQKWIAAGKEGLSLDECDITMLSLRSLHTWMNSVTTLETGSSILPGSEELTLDDLHTFFIFHDADDPASRVFVRSVMQAWTMQQLVHDEQIPFIGDASKITEAFYEKYVPIQSDKTKVTVDPELEWQRIHGELEESLQNGILPREATVDHPIRICFVGIGEGRIEQPIVEFLQSKTKGYKFVGVDIYDPENKIAGVDYERGSLEALDAIANKRGPFTRIYAFGSSTMDILVPEERMKMYHAISHSLAPGGQVIIDMAFPRGKDSYWDSMRRYHTMHNKFSLGYFERQWTDATEQPFGKPFYLSPYEEWVLKWEEEGMKIQNMPRGKKLDELMHALDTDDSFLEQEQSLATSALYKSHPGQMANRWNRAMYIIAKPSATEERPIMYVGSSF